MLKNFFMFPQRLLYVVLFGFCIFVYPVTVRAFAVSPILYDHTLNPGASIQDSIHITNDTEERQTYYVTVQNFIAIGEEGRQEFLPEDNTSGLVTWMTLDKKSVTLESGEGSDFKWILNLPKDAEPGGHYAAIFFSTIPPTEAKSSVGVGAKTGVLFLVNVNGDVKESLKIESFGTFSSKKVTSSFNKLPIGFEMRIKNEGNIHIKPRGTITIKNILGNTVGSVSLNPNESRVLPSSIRKVLSIWGGKEIEDTKGFLDELKAEWKGFAIGKYTAKAELVYGKMQKAASSEVTFWVFPWRLMLLCFIGFIFLFLILKVYNKMVVKSALKKSKTLK